MAASATQNPAIKQESKSSKKKKAAKGEASVEVQAVATPDATQSTDPLEGTNSDGQYESPYIKELYKSIRNVNKKITNASKVDNILAENPDKSLEELVSTRKINADQKAQILKKPALQASLTQLEDQIAQYKKFDEDFKARAQSDKAQLEKDLTDRANKNLEEAVAAAKKDAHAATIKEQEQSLLLVSQFLRLAAVRRSEDQDAELDENKALEGLLAAVYTGNSQAVSAMVNLIQGSKETIRGVDNEDTSVTYSKIKALAIEENSSEVDEPETTESVAGESTTTAENVQTDPTIANAGLTEIDADQTTPLTTGAVPTADADEVPQNSGFGDGANAAAEANWDNNNDLATSQEWVKVPEDTNENETAAVATPAVPANTQSWADEQPDSPNEKSSTAPANNNDGFHEVQRNRGQNRNQPGGQYRGRGGRGGEGRGRGGYRGRGEGGRGRGRGGQDRGGRRPENDAQ